MNGKVNSGQSCFWGENNFHDVFCLYFPKMVAYAELLIGKDAANDVVQDVFLNLWEDRDDLNILNIKSYLYRSTYNRCLNIIKHQKVVQNVHSTVEAQMKELELRMFDPDNNEVFKRLINEDLGNKISKAINELPSKCRQAFVLSYIHNLKNKEISEALNLSERTVESHIYNALRNLRKKLNE